MQYRGSFGSYVQSTWLLESDSGTTVVCWETSWTTVEDDEHKDKEEAEEEEEEDCWLEDLVLFLEKKLEKDQFYLLITKGPLRVTPSNWHERKGRIKAWC